MRGNPQERGSLPFIGISLTVRSQASVDILLSFTIHEVSRQELAGPQDENGFPLAQVVRGRTVSCA